MEILNLTGNNTNRCEAITDIIMSVALEQASLACILNAEGEKLQKIMKTQCNPDIILKTNLSVVEMVNAITRLENVLHAKLALFEDCLCDDCCCRHKKRNDANERKLKLPDAKNE